MSPERFSAGGPPATPAPATFPRALTPPPLGVYIHLPWCVRKCPYCDFNSHALRAALPEAAYLQALLADLRQDLECVPGRRVETVFFGGGTPSLFAPQTIGRLLEAIAPHARDPAALEVTLEANPGTVEHGRFRDYRAAGVNRLSIGVQTFNRAQLQALGRIHDEQAAHAALEEARSAGIENFNIDLMYGLPGQSVAQAVTDVLTACGHGPAHISHYQLTVEPDTAFHKHPPSLPDEDSCWDMQREAQAVLAQHGYGQYEISAYARGGHECAHNLNYWNFGDYLGIGAGAHGKLTHATEIRRTHKRRQPGAYLAAAAGAQRIESATEVTPPTAVFEFMLNALRLRRGFRAADLVARTGCLLDSVQPRIQSAIERELLEASPEGWHATELGLRFLNDLQASFLPQ